MKSLRFRILPLAAAFIGLMALGAAVVSAQDPAGTRSPQAGPPGTIRVRVRLIPVDVIVTDQRDKPVLDLKPEDFQVFENGLLQDIRHFTVQTFSADNPKTSPRAPEGAAAATGFVAQPARTFLILMGRGRHQVPFRAVDSLIRFVRTGLLPQDRVAVFAYNRATDFTVDHERIAQVLERYKKSNDEIESWLDLRFRGLALIYGLRDIPKSFQSRIDQVFQSGDRLASRQLPPGRMTEKGTIVRDWAQAADLLTKDSDRAAEADLRQEVAEESAETGLPGSQIMLSLIRFDTIAGDFATFSLPFDQFAPKAAGSFQDMQNLYTCVEYLRYMDGEKHLIYFTGEGLLFPNGNVSYDKGVVAMANDARVAIETFHTGGTFADPEMVPTKGVTLPSQSRGSRNPLPPPPPELSPANWSKAFMLSVLGNVSALTGGRATIDDNIDKALNRLDETTRVQYLLGYYPQDNRWDGRYRQIQVKVNRPAVKVSYRHGYFARDTLRPYDREEFLAYNRIAAAGAYEADLGDIPFKTSTAKTQDESGNAQIQIDLQIDPAKVGFKMVDVRHLGRLYIVAYYADRGGNYLGDNWRTVNMDLTEEGYQNLLRSGIKFSTRIPQKAPNQLVKVIVYDTWGDKVGSKLIKTR